MHVLLHLAARRVAFAFHLSAAGTCLLDASTLPRDLRLEAVLLGDIIRHAIQEKLLGDLPALRGRDRGDGIKQDALRLATLLAQLGHAVRQRERALGVKSEDGFQSRDDVRSVRVHGKQRVRLPQVLVKRHHLGKIPQANARFAERSKQKGRMVAHREAGRAAREEVHHRLYALPRIEDAEHRLGRKKRPDALGKRTVARVEDARLKTTSR